MSTDGSSRKEKQNRCGGLHGKARYSRFRNRAWRLHSQQLIEEFVEPAGTPDKNTRRIPIKRRAEFVPSAPVLGSEYGVGTEQELELVYTTDAREQSVQVGLFDQAFALVSPTSKEDAAITFSRSQSELRTEPNKPGVQRSERKALIGSTPQDSPTKAETGSPSVESFTARGFVFGCALGTAVAAVLLMMVRAVIL